jgi:hypothetical protein
MDEQAIPDEEDLAAELAEEHAQVANDRQTVIALLTHVQEEAPIERNATDR